MIKQTNVVGYIIYAHISGVTPPLEVILNGSFKGYVKGEIRYEIYLCVENT